VFGKGEGPRRECTKVGGLPYWPAGRPWPKDGNGAPYRYLAQFNFADSRDLVAELPGDVLLLFVPEGNDWLFEPDCIHFEWLPLGLDAVTSFDSSLGATTAGPFFGAIYRAVDYPEAMPKAKTCWVHGRDEIAIINATKIGGLPYLIQDRDLDGEFLCQLNSIQAAPLAQYPWVNSPEPLALEFGDRGIFADANTFVMMDMGNIYIFRTGAGKVKSSIESY
jgi:hypothetical protein